MSASRQSTKVSIPHTSEDGISIVGSLEQLEPTKPTQGRKIALFYAPHAYRSDGGRHKDYLFQKRLALSLPLDSFRFDFRGNHETGGTWKYSGLTEDMEDLCIVVDHLTRVYGYEIDLLVAHSRGSLVAFHWFCTSEDAKRVGGLVNVSGRYQMNRIYEQTQQYQASFKERGYYDWETVVARKRVVGRIYPSDIEQFANWRGTAAVWDKFPQHTDVLSVHGLADKTVSPYDSMIFARALGAREGGTHNLHYIEDGDHIFTGVRLLPVLLCLTILIASIMGFSAIAQKHDEVIQTILAWWEMRTRGELRTGVWQTGIRGKL
ncbi:Esterase/lipase/thioesterase [Heterobasidion irregulare TC 32-1]|uniref:Esterase/lipase/thioesterase n=1 Tax=Heterobasidion irregulare (strain TC 32-1) TaxID=747525 RepID=W4K8H2_HETIT|nr:Esterase/lipase/thioesterase [Heterobasidion irregulare TC 32-1]ETW82132.1 Esterase/lipase/thioesterase [Heterobasidion irregulare TC 32-1]